MTMQYTEVDPFAGGDKYPALKFETVGTTYSFTVAETPKEIQDRDIKTGKPLVWEDSGKPKLKVVITVEVDGENHGLWMKKPSALFGAIKDAAREAGLKGIPVGTKGVVRYSADKPMGNGMNPQKQFQVKITPAAPAPKGDPFGDDIPPF